MKDLILKISIAEDISVLFNDGYHFDIGYMCQDMQEIMCMAALMAGIFEEKK